MNARERHADEIYLRKAKNTAATMSTKATIWFYCKASLLNTVVAITVKTVKEIAS